MRKVTASAVVLTALTGCTQSSIPSTQWSFEVPSEEQDKDISGTALVASQSPSDRTQSSLSKSTQSSVEQPLSGRMMGPAFEQPSDKASTGARVSAVGRPGSKEISTLAAEAYGVTNDISIRPSTRPDPVAQVRAYLRSSGSPSALTNRTPYRSEVYLSSLPTPNRYYEPSLPAIATDFPIGTSDLGLVEALPLPLSDSAPALGESLASTSVNSGISDSASIWNGESIDPVLLSESFTYEDESARSASATAESTAIFNSELPVLQASALQDAAEADSFSASLSSDTAQFSTAQSSSSTAQSIGTTILQGLEAQSPAQSQSSQGDVTTANLATDEGLPSLNSNRADAAESIASYGSDEFAQTQVTQASAAAFYESGSYEQADTSGQEEYSQQEYGVDRLETAYVEPAYAEPSVEPLAQSIPSLTSLTETMPARDISPLVDSFRASESFTIEPEPYSGTPLSLVNDQLTISTELETEFETEVEADSSLNEDFRLAPTNASSIDMQSNTRSPKTLFDASIQEAYSPLLQGLVDSQIDSTIYVPIAEDSVLDNQPSSLLLQPPSDTFSTFSEDLSASNLLDQLSGNNTLPTVLLSSALEENSSFITLTSLQRSVENKTQVKKSIKRLSLEPTLSTTSEDATPEIVSKAAHRSETIALAAKQISSRRQRLMWM